MKTGLIALELIAKMNSIPFDSQAMIREYSLSEDEISLTELILIARKVKFKAKQKTFPIEQFPSKYPLPTIFELKDQTYGVVLKINSQEKEALIFLPKDKTTKVIPFTQFNQISTGNWIILKHKFMYSQVAFGFKWFFYEILAYKSIIVEVLLGSFIVQLLGLVTPLFTQVILDKVIVHRSLVTLQVLAVAFLMVIIFDFILNLTRNYLFLHTASKIDAKLGAKLFRHLFALPFRFFENRKVGDIIARVRELDNIREFITNKAVSVIIDLFFSTVFLVIMFFYSVKLTLLTIGIIALIAIIYAVVTPVFRDKLNKKFQMGAQSNSYLVEAVTGIHTVKSLSIEGSMQRKWNDFSAQYIHANFNLGTLGNFTRGITGLLQKLLTIGILYFGVQMVIKNDLTIGQLIAFQMFSNQFLSPVLRLVTLWNEFQQAILGVERLSDILNHPTEVDSDTSITLAKLDGAIKLEHISFRYADHDPLALQDISFQVQPGKCVGIVGRSGSGKSTITKLIQRLYLSMEGAIFIDDVDIRHMNPSWLRYQIGIVLQENYLFSGTIKENIAFAKPDASMDEIVSAAKLSSAHDFISDLPQGYDTPVGERGSTLSGGQKQRITIARALITNPKILIFDEATSALDAESEEVIFQHFDKIKQDRTVIIVSHRLKLVRDCDLIIALDKGVIQESGTHSELIKQGGYYAMLHQIQFNKSGS